MVSGSKIFSCVCGSKKCPWNIDQCKWKNTSASVGVKHAPVSVVVINATVSGKIKNSSALVVTRSKKMPERLQCESSLRKSLCELLLMRPQSRLLCVAAFSNSDLCFYYFLLFDITFHFDVRYEYVTFHLQCLSLFHFCLLYYVCFDCWYNSWKVNLLSNKNRVLCNETFIVLMFGNRTSDWQKLCKRFFSPLKPR